MNSRAHTVTPARVPRRGPSERLRRHLAGLGLASPEARWVPLSGGLTSRVWRVETGAEPLLCKLTRPGPASPLFPIDPAVEARLMRCLAPQGLSARCRWWGRHGADNLLVAQFARGRASARTVAALGTQLAALHRVPVPLGLPRRVTLERGLLRAGLAHLERAGVERADLYRIFAAAEAAANLPPVADRVVHGDPVPNNVVVYPGRRPFLIDWHAGGRGHPARDLALALSPGLHAAAGTSPPRREDRERFLDAYLAGGGDPGTIAVLDAIEAAIGVQVIAHCAWRAARGVAGFNFGLRAQLAELLQSGQ